MPDNLSISISADTSKARADLELLNAKVRELRKEVRAASAEAQAGGGMTPRLAEATKAITAAEAQQRAYARAARATTEANVEASASFAGLGKDVAGFARAAGLATAGTRALRFGLLAMVGAEVIRGFTQVIDKITELSDASKKSGFDPKTIDAFGQALAKTGGHAEDAAGIFDKLASHTKLASDIYGKTFLEADDSLKALNYDLSRLRPGSVEFFTAVAQALVKLNASGRVDEANLRSTEILGKNYREIGAALEVIAKGGAQQTSLIASPEALEAAKQYTIALSELKTAWDDLIVTIGTSGAFDAVTELMKEAAATIKTTTQEIIGLARAIGAVADAMGLVPHDFGGGGSLPDARQFATGGYVSGAGSATSDSILARLSNGEFVMRAAAVDRWGPQFLQALNNLRNPFGGFASGGLVSARSIPSFAGGGMVHTAGATVNLVFPGGTFALRADNETVGALTREARRAGMLSGGRRAGLLQ